MVINVRFRAFIAVEVAPTERLLSLLNDLGKIGPGLKPVEKENVHVTLKFLGDIEERLVTDVERCMRDSVAGVAPFTIFLKGTGYFPPKGPAKTLWVGIEGAEPMVHIANRLEKDLKDLGFEPEERPFKPHLTVGRVKDNKAAFASEMAVHRYKDEVFGPQVVSSIKLKRSILGRFGPTYSDIIEVQLH